MKQKREPKYAVASGHLLQAHNGMKCYSITEALDYARHLLKAGEVVAIHPLEPKR